MNFYNKRGDTGPTQLFRALILAWLFYLVMFGIAYFIK